MSDRTRLALARESFAYEAGDYFARASEGLRRVREEIARRQALDAAKGKQG